RTHQRTDPALQDAPERPPRPARPAQDGEPPPQAAGLSEEQGRRTLFGTDPQARPAQVSRLSFGGSLWPDEARANRRSRSEALILALLCHSTEARCDEPRWNGIAPSCPERSRFACRRIAHAPRRRPLAVTRHTTNGATRP